MAQSAPTTTPQTAKEEMWLIILAKSKTMRFFAVSCEFILFLGCLWLTMTTILPSASTWANDAIDNFFLVAMGFAVDAAMPEAWLHVVDQWTDNPKKTMHLRWSISIAIGMSLLVVANVTYAKIVGTTGAQPTGALETVVNTLLIARILIGISYVAIRECQSFLNRKMAKQQAAQPTTPDIQQMITQAITDLQRNIDQRLAAITTEQGRMLATIQQVQLTPATAPTIDNQAIIAAVVAQFETRFTTAMKHLEAEMKQRVSVSPASGTPPSGTALSGPKLVPLPGRSVPPRPMERTQVERETPDQGPNETGESADCKSSVYAYLDQDNTLQAADLAHMTGYPKTTVWRHWTRYHEEHGTRGQARIVAQVETA